LVTHHLGKERGAGAETRARKKRGKVCRGEEEGEHPACARKRDTPWWQKQKWKGFCARSIRKEGERNYWESKDWGGGRRGKLHPFETVVKRREGLIGHRDKGGRNRVRRRKRRPNSSLLVTMKDKKSSAN